MDNDILNQAHNEYDTIPHLRYLKTIYVHGISAETLEGPNLFLYESSPFSF